MNLFRRNKPEFEFPLTQMTVVQLLQHQERQMQALMTLQAQELAVINRIAESTNRLITLAQTGGHGDTTAAVSAAVDAHAAEVVSTLTPVADAIDNAVAALTAPVAPPTA